MPNKKIDFDKMARTYLATGKIGEAMVAGGYSLSSSQSGRRSMSPTNRVKFDQAVDRNKLKMLSKFAEIGKQVTAEQQQDLVRGALLSNVAEGEDKATGSLKLLGNDRRVNMFTPENASGVIIIQAAHIPSFPENSTHNITEKLGCGCYGICHCGKSALPQSAVEAR